MSSLSKTPRSVTPRLRRWFAFAIVLVTALTSTLACSNAKNDSGGSPPVFELSETPSPVATGSGSIAILTLAQNGQNVTKAYIPLKGVTTDGHGRIAVLQVDPIVSPARINTILLSGADEPSGCAANPRDGRIVCIGFDSQRVYIIDSLTDVESAVLTASVSGVATVSGGKCRICSVVIDPEGAQAVLGTADGLMRIDLESASILSTSTSPSSENLGFDSARRLVFAPHYQRNSDGSMQSGMNVLRLSDGGLYEFTGPMAVEPDAAAADGGTGLLVVTDEHACTLLIYNLVDAVFDDASRTFEAPVGSVILNPCGAQKWLASGIAIDENSHLAFLEEEFGSMVAVVRLPQSAASGVPGAAKALSYVVAEMPEIANGTDWTNPGDPHGVAVWYSPTAQQAFGFLINEGGSVLAKIDLAAFLAAPVLSGNRVQIESNVVTYIPTE